MDRTCVLLTFWDKKSAWSCNLILKIAATTHDRCIRRGRKISCQISNKAFISRQSGNCTSQQNQERIEIDA